MLECNSLSRRHRLTPTEACRQLDQPERPWKLLRKFQYPGLPVRVFHPAVEQAGLDWLPRIHDLRHASASWALAGGATVEQVRVHLGQVSLRAVERYLHNLPGTERTACQALARVRSHGSLHVGSSLLGRERVV